MYVTCRLSREVLSNSKNCSPVSVVVSGVSCAFSLEALGAQHVSHGFSEDRSCDMNVKSMAG